MSLRAHLTDADVMQIMRAFRNSTLTSLDLTGPGAALHLSRRRSTRAFADELIVAPYVGIFTPHPDIILGASVATGDLLGHIRSIGQTVDLRAGSPGHLTEISVPSGRFVEFGQTLFTLRLSPQAEGAAA